jgi:transglutaminase-like putative cysteine protease
MNIRARHTTTYLYREPVSICHTEVRLAPRDNRHQHVLEHSLTVFPLPDRMFGNKDYFGNNVLYFSIHEPHEMLTIASDSVIALDETQPPDPRLTPPWEQAAAEEWRHEQPHGLKAYQFVFESPRIAPGPEFAEYARPSFTAGRPLLEACLDLGHRIHTDFRYDQRATTVATSVAEVLKNRRGVCQDFAHLAIACLRSLGLAARYVSGYLKNEEMVGSQASHAWVAAFCPGFGWLAIDPTNDQLANSNHIVLAYGRDYSDVAPVKGVAVGGGEQVIDISVVVEPAAA